MKILVAYDGSSCAEAVPDDLMRAGLPEVCDTLVFSVAEVWLPPPNVFDDVTGIHLDQESEFIIQRHYENSKRKVEEAASLAGDAKRRLQEMFPNWQLNSDATYGSPAWAILELAEEFKADLIVVGSHGRSALSRFFLGSISQKVLTEARCSVRVARSRTIVDSDSVRLIIGFDGSKGAQAAVTSVASRSWGEQIENRLIAATEEVTPSDVGRFIPPIASIVEEVNETELRWTQKCANRALKELQSKDIAATLVFCSGNPKHVLVEGAEKWNADCIFVGANAFGSRLERFLLGSTSAAVAARAHCSVEVVRACRLLLLLRVKEFCYEFIH